MASALDDSVIGNIDRSVVNVSDIEDVDQRDESKERHRSSWVSIAGERRRNVVEDEHLQVAGSILNRPLSPTHYIRLRPAREIYHKTRINLLASSALVRFMERRRSAQQKSSVQQGWRGGRSIMVQWLCSLTLYAVMINALCFMRSLS
jgi:hypothetical protein